MFTSILDSLNNPLKFSVPPPETADVGGIQVYQQLALIEKICVVIEGNAVKVKVKIPLCYCPGIYYFVVVLFSF